MSELRERKEFEELKFCDDFMFGKVMEDPRLCRDVLECLLQHPVGELTEVQTQREFKYTSDGKSIRLDVYNKGSDGSVYDTEMQNLNNKSVSSLELPKRSRFYQSSMDMDYLDKGGYYKNLPDSNILFICTFDPFEKGMGRYTLRGCCEEDPTVEFNDGITRIFFNCTYKGGDLPESIIKLYKYIENERADSDLTKRIDAAVKKGRKNEMWRSQYIKEQNILRDAREDGKEEGREEGRAERDALRKENDTLRKEIEELKKLTLSLNS